MEAWPLSSALKEFLEFFSFFSIHFRRCSFRIWPRFKGARGLKIEFQIQELAGSRLAGIRPTEANLFKRIQQIVWKSIRPNILNPDIPDFYGTSFTLDYLLPRWRLMSLKAICREINFVHNCIILSISYYSLLSLWKIRIKIYYWIFCSRRPISSFHKSLRIN